jgi:hypothetical protein
MTKKEQIQTDLNCIETEAKKKMDLNSKKPKAEKKIDLKNIAPEDKMKYEIAEELGLLDRVVNNGWKSLTAKETGRIGGIINKRKHSQK